VVFYYYLRRYTAIVTPAVIAFHWLDKECVKGKIKNVCENTLGTH
jgi:hypothetical protein